MQLNEDNLTVCEAVMPDGTMRKCVYGFKNDVNLDQCAKINNGVKYELVIDSTGTVSAHRIHHTLLDSFDKYRNSDDGKQYSFWDYEEGSSYPSHCFDKICNDSKYAPYLIAMIEVYRHIKKLTWGYWVVTCDEHYHSTERRYVTSYTDLSGNLHVLGVVDKAEAPQK